jgi:hypothetical protein
MNELVVRYIHDVTRRLPKSDRSEARHKLEELISGKLSVNASDDEVAETLKKLGAPKDIAEQYRRNPRYLISPALFNPYISCLRIVVAVVAIVFACIGAFSAISDYSRITTDNIGSILIAAGSTAFDGALLAAFVITLGFALAESIRMRNRAWEISELPPTPGNSGMQGARILRSSTVVETVLLVFATALFVMLIERGERFIELASDSPIVFPFTLSVMNSFVPFLLLFGLLGLIVNCLKLYWARWNLPLCVVNVLFCIGWLGITCYVLHWPNLFSAEFLQFASETVSGNSFFSSISYNDVILTTTALAIAVASLEIVSSIFRTYKGYKRRKYRNLVAQEAL